MLALGYDRPIAEDPRPALIQAGATLRVTEGPFTDTHGVCLWDDRKRVAMLIDLFGRPTQVEVARKAVMEVAR